MPLQATSGAASYDAFGGGVPVVPQYIEEVFSTYVYTGVSGSNVTINNGINLSVNGGLIWSKGRNGANPNSLTDTVRGVANALNSASIFASGSSGISSFTTTGYVTNTSGSTNGSSSETYVSWTLRKQPKFFDIQTWTGSGANRTISHNLGSVPGCIMVKCLDDDLAWAVYHRSLTSAAYSVPFSVLTPTSTPTVWNSTAPTSTVFSVGTDATVNASGGTYVAYIYAHDAGGFGLLSTDNVISCGSFTTDGAGAATVNLGYEPQWILMKRTNDYDNWYLIDNMRGWLANTTSNCQLGLYANSSGAEAAGFNGALQLTSTGFIAGINTDSTFIYIAIRRGPMKVPTSGTSVFSPVVRTGTSAAATVSTTNLTDMSLIINKDRSSNSYNIVSDRLRGPANTTSGSYNLSTNATVAEYLPGLATVTGFNNNNVTLGTNDGVNYSGSAYINYFFSRAPSFFDEVCYTGTGVLGRTVTHNLTTVPELIIVKDRGNIENWVVYSAPVGNTKALYFNRDWASTASGGYWNNTTPTSTVFSVSSSGVGNNDSGVNYVAYLFATCAGVSKVTSFTGNGSSQTINCGFTAGSRFVMIKRTDSTGDWYVWDSARGIVSGNDPHLSLNSTAAEVTTDDTIDTDSTGFIVNQVSATNSNVNGASYIVLAIA